MGLFKDLTVGRLAMMEFELTISVAVLETSLKTTF